MTPTEPVFPPLFTGVPAPEGTAPADHAVTLARAGCDGGTVVHDLGRTDLAAALILAPDVTLGDAVMMLPVCGIGLQNALGALAPPEVAVHLCWDGRIHLNGARCGALGLLADDASPDRTPDWLIVTLDVAFLPPPGDTGDMPDRTALYAEGCGELTPPILLEAWVRHSLVWMNRWMEDGAAALARDWIGLAHGLDENVTFAGRSGRFLGIDERFGALLAHDGTTEPVPLTLCVAVPANPA